MLLNLERQACQLVTLHQNVTVCNGLERAAVGLLCKCGQGSIQMIILCATDVRALLYNGFCIIFIAINSLSSLTTTCLALAWGALLIENEVHY